MSSEWPAISLDELTDGTTITYGVIKPGNECVDGVKFIRGGDVVAGQILSAQLRTITPEVSQQYSRTLLQGGELLVSLVGNPGEVALVPPSLKGANIARQVGLVRVDAAKADANYIQYFLRSKIGRDGLLAHSKGSVQQVINLKDLKSVKVPLPPIKVQRSVAGLMQALDDRITLLRETNATLEAIAAALFKSWFVDFDPVRAKMEGRIPEGMDEATAALFPDSFEESELGLVPRGWTWGALSDFATFQNGHAFKSKDWTDTGHPVIKIGDVKSGIIDLSNCSRVSQRNVIGLERFRLKRGDLLVSMTGYVGETGLVPAVEPDAYLNQRVGRISTKGGYSDLGYVYCAVRSAAFKEFTEAHSHGSAQANVSGSSLMAFPVATPSASVMKCFNCLLASVLETILLNYEQSKTLSNLRDTILPRLISGTLRLNDSLPNSKN